MSVDKVLKGHTLFQSFSVEDAHTISNFSSTRKFKAKETIFAHNDTGGHVYMLMDGSVSLLLPGDVQDYNLVISNVVKGELFGLSPLLDSPRYTATALCKEDTEVLSIEAKPFRELLRSSSDVGFNMMNQVAHIYFSRYISVLKSLQGVVNQVSLIR